MPFSLRPYRRFPVCCPVTYHAGLREGHGTVWNLSVNEWRLSGDVPRRTYSATEFQAFRHDGKVRDWFRKRRSGKKGRSFGSQRDGAARLNSREPVSTTAL